MGTFAPMINVILKSGKDASLRRYHPWVFSGAIKKIKANSGQEIEPEEGALVKVVSNHDEFLGIGHYQNGSIAVRVLSFEEVDVNQQFWVDKFTNALSLRHLLNLKDNPDTNIYRLIHAEGDGLPGLIIDFYAGTAVIQSHSIGMHFAKDEIVTALKTVYGADLKAIFDKSAGTLPKNGPVEVEDDYLYQTEGFSKVGLEHGCKFNIDWEKGQKTGFFIDQRDNRALLASYAKDKTVLNTFCYTGGFSLAALNAGASHVDSVDASARAIDLTNDNVALNGFEANHEAFAIDTFKFFDENDISKYDIVVLDPPAFAKHQNVKHNAVKGYKRLNVTALKAMKSGSLLFTFSCSQVIDSKLFYNTIMAACIQTERKVRVLHQVTQPADHPINIYHAESHYLKGLVLQVI